MTNLAIRDEVGAGRWMNPGVLVVPAPRVKVDRPETRLMLAVLESAISDWLVRRTTCTAPRHDARVTVEEDLPAWFASTDRSWPYSFENICGALGLDADGIRRRIGIG
jgi:hypothetical protein